MEERINEYRRWYESHPEAHGELNSCAIIIPDGANQLPLYLNSPGIWDRLKLNVTDVELQRLSSLRINHTNSEKAKSSRMDIQSTNWVKLSFGVLVIATGVVLYNYI